ncbi:hypothetical protein [Streptomyces sp. NPDC020917]|uniref:hypothetical protein n=1 Tax=Streptomyces sp. NPDC020917 TaxID=3365102 RepID=UPI00379A9ED0
MGLALAAAALLVSAANGAAPRPVTAVPQRPTAPTPPRPRHEVLVRAPIRIADAAAAHLLRPGDRVDVLAAARVVAAGATVVEVPADADEASALSAAHDGVGTGVGGALVVVSVPRGTAAALSGAAAASPLAVALC